MQTHTNGTLFLRLLLNKFSTVKPDALTQVIPKEDVEALEAHRIAHNDPSVMLFRPKEWLTSIDSSWLKPTVDKMAKPLQEVYARAFPKQFGNPKDPQIAYSDAMQEFLIQFLHTSWAETEAPPKGLLPHWEMSPLLDLSKSEILDIIDLLAMYDLVEEMRQIVDKKLLQAVLQHLSTEQQQYLRVLLRQKSRQTSTSISVRELLKEANKFPQMLHKLGLQRLSFALSGASDDFLWHILHTLDLNRAKFLQNHIKKEEVPNQTPQALVQVQHIIHFLKTETAP